MYRRGEGVPQDYVEAVKWYRLAAEQGHAYAQNKLGNMYQFGEGLTQDILEAMRWFRLAADQGTSLSFAQMIWERMAKPAAIRLSATVAACRAPCQI